MGDSIPASVKLERIETEWHDMAGAPGWYFGRLRVTASVPIRVLGGTFTRARLQILFGLYLISDRGSVAANEAMMALYCYQKGSGKSLLRRIS